MNQQKKNYPPDLKAKIVLETLRSSETDTSIAQQYEIHPVTLSRWKAEFRRNAGKVFGADEELENALERCDELERRVAKLEAESELLRDIFETEIDTDTKVQLVNRYKDKFGLNRACDAVGLPKSTYYYRMDDSE